MKKNLFLTILFSLLLNGILYSQIEFQNGSFEDPDNDIKYSADGSGGGSPTKMDNNLTGWWADAFATDCGRESPRTEGTIPDGKYVGFAYNNDGGSVWNLAGTVEPGKRDLTLTCYVQESWPQGLSGLMSIIIKFATYEGSDPSEFELVDSLSLDWDNTDADENGFVLYEFLEILPSTTEGKNLLIGFDIATVGTDGTWVNFDNFELSVYSVTGVQNISLKNTKVYPSPAKDYITIDTKTDELSDYCLMNIAGKKMLTGSVNCNDRIDVSSLNNGVYFLNIHNSLGSEVIKTMIK